MTAKTGFIFQGSLANAGPFALFDNGTHSSAIGIDSTGRFVISRSSSEGASSSDSGEFVVDTSGNIEMNPTSTVTISSGNLILTTGFVETTSGVILIGATSGNITLEAPATVTSYALEFPPAQGTAAQVLTQSSTPGILEWATPTTGTVDSVTATSPVFSSGGANPNITIQAASGSQEGALLAADWTTFNNKVSQGGNSYGATMIVGTNDAHTLELIADGTPALTITSAGNITVDAAGTLALTAGLIFEGSSSGSVTLFAPSAVTSYNLTLPAAQGTSTQVLTQSGTPGILQWSTPTTGTVTSVTGTSPIASSGGSTPAISIQAASGSQEGALLAADWTTFNNKVSQGGNSYGALMSIGTNDSNSLDLRTNGTNRLSIDTSGNVVVAGTGTITTTGGLILDGSVAGSITLQSAVDVVTPYTVTMPAAQGTANQALAQSSISGNLIWQNFLLLTGGTLTGSLTISNGGDLILEGTGGGFFQLVASPTTSSYAITMPPAQGSVGQVLAQSSVVGAMQWSTPTTGTVTSVTGTSPIASSGGATPAISIQNATTSQTGALTSTDWNTFNNKVAQGGNSYGTGMIIGTIDNNSLNFNTDNTHQASIDTSGNMTLANGSLTVAAGNLNINGTGYIQINNGNVFLYNQGQMIFYGTSGGSTNIRGAAAITAYTLTLPGAQGAANQVLAQSSTPGTLQWTTPVTVDTMAWYNSASSLAIPNSSTQITFNSVSSPGYNLNPPNSTFNLTTGTFTPAATGYYLVTCNLTFTSTSANSDVHVILENITTSTNIYQTYASFPIVTSSNGYTPVSFSTVLSLSSADSYGVFATASVSSGVTLYTSGSGAMFNNITFLRVQ